MSRWGKRKEKFGGDSEAKAYPNKVAKTEDSDDSENIVVCELSGKRRVSVRSWQGKIWVDIRDFYEKDGKVLPGKKGITLNMDQWNILRDHIEEIDEAVSEKS
uniref:Transcriptional coactivator p15 (PC4) C-terminal domain-containing protein n=1 Tax=Kalanchoe fedtschenkoi TaxID=63787 RepID=A0A7N0TX74_KALFE